MFIDVLLIIVHSIETIQMSINSQMFKQIWHTLTMKYYWGIKWEKPLLCSNMDKSQNFGAGWMKSERKDDVLYNSTYMKFQNKQNSWIAIEMWSLTTWCRGFMGIDYEGSEENFCWWWNVHYHNWGNGCIYGIDFFK